MIKRPGGDGDGNAMLVQQRALRLGLNKPALPAPDDLRPASDTDARCSGLQPSR